MTEKLYYTDPLTTEFSAVVLSCARCENGWAAELDRTAGELIAELRKSYPLELQ